VIQVINVFYELNFDFLTYDGEFQLAEVGRPCRVLESFHTEFREIIKRLSYWLLEYPEADAAFHRTDYGGTYGVGAEQLRMLRQDPVEAIRYYCPENIVVAAKPKKEKSVNVCLPLLAGIDARAQCFGDVVFLRVRTSSYAVDGAQAECPCCGTWTKVYKGEGEWGLHCEECRATASLEGYHPEEGWVGVRTFALLGMCRPTYFLPRRWNTFGNDITHEELSKMYERYTKEKEQVS
jgi:hypothetical protein